MGREHLISRKTARSSGTLKARMKRRAVLIAIVVIWASTMAQGRAVADLFELTNQGSLRGQLLNPEEVPRKKFVVRTVNGAVVTFDRTQVVKQHRESLRDLEYEAKAPTYPDTVEGQWKLAEWCRENKLTKARNAHLERVLHLNPDHQLARRALNYVQVDGGWKTREQIQKDRGLVQYKGEWKLPQEIEVLEKKKKDRLAERQWIVRLNDWRGDLQSDKAAEVTAKLRAIDDPYAIKAIAESLTEEPNQQVRIWLLESLSKIPAPDATTLLVGVALHDGTEEVRLSALDFLVEQKNPEVPAMFIAALRDNNVPVINRAAVALKRLNHPAAVGPLIDALVVVQKIDYVEGQPGGVGATFGKGPNGAGMGGLSVGQSVQTKYVTHQNPDVLDALIKLTGRNFEHEVTAWKSWFAQQKKPETLDGRRN